VLSSPRLYGEKVAADGSPRPDEGPQQARTSTNV
jgi:hypothetical protein